MLMSLNEGPMDRATILVTDRIRVALLLAVAFLLIDGERPVAEEAGAPRIEFASREVDFGEIAAGEVVSHEFVFTNAGSAPLEILNVQPSCGCTTAENAEQTVEPGQRGVIPIQFNSRGFSGKINKSVRVTSNDPEQGNVVLRLSAEIWTPIRLEPKTLVFQYDGAAETGEAKVVRISSNLDKPITLEPPESTNQSFKLELKTLEAGREFELQVQTVPPIGTGTVSMPITIKTSTEEMPVLRMTAHAIERQPVLVSPSVVRLPAGPVKAMQKIRVVVRCQSNFDLELSNPQVDLPEVTLDMEEVQPGRLFYLTLNLPAGWEGTTEETGELTIDSNHPRYPKLRVPIQRQVARPVKVRPTPAQVGVRRAVQSKTPTSEVRKVPARD